MTKREARMLIGKCAEMGLRLDLRHYPDGNITAVQFVGPYAAHYGEHEVYETALTQARLTIRNNRRECSTSP